MDKNILTTLEEKSLSFSKGQMRIARYILSDLEKAAFLTAGALGKVTEVSESTVVRFAAELGYDGFPQMQKALQDALMDRFCGKNAENSPPNLQKEGIFDAVRALLSARRIYLLANGPEKVLAEYMGICLEKQFPDVHTLSGSTGKLRHAGAGDVAVVFSFPPYSRETEEAAAYCRNAGVRVIGITNSERSPLCVCSNNCLFANVEEKSYGLSLVRPMALVEEVLNALTSGKDGSAYEI